MLISLKSDIILKSIKIYSIEYKNKKVIDATFDKLYQ